MHSVERQSTFRRKISLPSSALRNKQIKKSAWNRWQPCPQSYVLGLGASLGKFNKARYNFSFYIRQLLTPMKFAPQHSMSVSYTVEFAAWGNQADWRTDRRRIRIKNFMQRRCDLVWGNYSGICLEGLRNITKSSVKIAGGPQACPEFKEETALLAQYCGSSLVDTLHKHIL
jgi:hypothetical protein